MTNEKRAPWTPPVLDQLSVDFDAIAAKKTSSPDGVKGTHSVT